MLGVIVGGVLVLAAFGLGLFGAVVIIRATSDAGSRSAVLAIKAGAVGAGRDVPEVSMAGEVAPRRGRVIQLPPAERRTAIEPAPGAHYPQAKHAEERAAAEPVRTLKFEGW